MTTAVETPPDARAPQELKGPPGGVAVTFVGGPWDGQLRRYRRNPRAVACVDDARAAGLRGLYKTPVETWKDETHVALSALWHQTS